MGEYNFTRIENKWIKYWEDKEIFKFLTNVNNDSYGTFLDIDKTDDSSPRSI